MEAMVLFSGGVDSTTCLAQAVKKHGAENVLALSVYYGQKHTKEICRQFLVDVILNYLCLCLCRTHAAVNISLDVYSFKMKKMFKYMFQWKNIWRVVLEHV